MSLWRWLKSRAFRRKFVISANAGIQIRFGSSSKAAWIPVSTGMT
jgi:hypothetical protein